MSTGYNRTPRVVNHICEITCNVIGIIGRFSKDNVTTS